MKSPPEPCPLCEATNSKPIECEFPGILKCQQCSFIFVEKSKHGNDAELYEEEFAEANRHPTYFKKNGRYVIRNEAKLNSLLDEMEPFRRTGNILDVGCSAAFFLKLASEHDWKCTGLDVSEWAVRFSREELGVPVIHGTLPEAKLPSGVFDIVFSSHVMEHVSQPLQMIQEMTRLLRVGGALVTIVPTQFCAPMWRLRRSLTGDPPPRHRAFFTRRTLNLFLVKAGLDPVWARYNIELLRLPQLFRSPKQNLRDFRILQRGGQAGEQKIKQIQESVAARVAKTIVNSVGSLFQIGDELVSLAIKR